MSEDVPGMFGRLDGEIAARIEQRGREIIAADHLRDQPPPVANDKPAVWPLVIDDVKRLYALKRRLACRMLIDDMTARDAVGRQRYGVPLQPFNGRAQMVDAYQEALDLCVYLRAAMCEGIDGVAEMYERGLDLALEIRARLPGSETSGA